MRRRTGGAKARTRLQIRGMTGYKIDIKSEGHPQARETTNISKELRHHQEERRGGLLTKAIIKDGCEQHRIP